MTTPAPLNPLDALCAKCGQTIVFHRVRDNACGMDGPKFHPTNRFTPKPGQSSVPPQPAAGEPVAGNVTPRPWRIGDVPVMSERKPNDTTDLYWPVFCPDAGCVAHVMGKKEASHIVHCVNTHDALHARVAVLERALRFLQLPDRVLER